MVLSDRQQGEGANVFGRGRGGLDKKVQHKSMSRIPTKVMFICAAVSRPNPPPPRRLRWQNHQHIASLRHDKGERTATARHQKCWEYAVYIHTIDSEYHQEWHEHELLPAIEEITPWLESRAAIVQQDGESPRTGKGAKGKLNKSVVVGKREVWCVAHSAREATTSAFTEPQHQRSGVLCVRGDKQGWWERSGTIDDLVEGVQRLSGEYEDYRKVSSKEYGRFCSRDTTRYLQGWGNEFEVEHTKNTLSVELEH